MKKIPLGIDDFDSLIREDYYFADKSLLIKAILDDSSKIFLIPRPRRFGKSLNLSMLKYFFTNKNKDKNSELFTNLKINREKDIMEKQGKYPLLYISFKDVKELRWENCFNKTKLLIQDVFSGFEYLYTENKLGLIDKAKIERIIYSTANQDDFEESFKLLTKLLYEYYGEKVIVLIDEYDQPIIGSYMNGYYKEGISFFRNFYSSVLKDNIYLEKAVLTGVLRVAKESIFSGLNNLYVDSILKNSINYFGLTEEDVVEILNHYNKEYELEEVKEWYNGYTFGKEQVYNPWSIINFIKLDELVPYWVNTSSNDLIKESLSTISNENYEDFIRLINGEEIEIYIEENISFDTIDRPTTIWNLMLFSGYLSLTIDKKIRFVNKEVRNFYISIFKTLAGADIGEFNKLLKFLVGKDLKNFKGLLQEIFLKAVSYYDTGTEEKYYHNLILGLVFGLENRYIIHSNREYGTGRVDLLLKSKDGKLPNYIFEFKLSKSKAQLKKDAGKALKQIEENQYGIEVENPVKIGMSFYKKEFEILISE